MTLIAGSKLGRYEIRSKIGAGGMGDVDLAQDMKLDPRFDNLRGILAWRSRCGA